jgi:membrane-bound lytic murein transglycosylase B
MTIAATRMLRAPILGVTALLGAILAAPPERAFAASPSQWVKDFWPAARDAKISRTVYDAALGDFTPDKDVLERANAQAEFTTPLPVYLGNSVSDERIADGKAMAAQYADTLARIERKYGVDRYVVLAIWGVESHYGEIFERPGALKATIRSLATLAYAGGKRARYGRTQLLAALKIIQRGDVSVHGMTGSWAGAMGHTQFIPTTYNAYAVDFDGDGKRNIWTSIPDALASTAHYLKVSKWQSGRTWGYEVVVPKGASAKALTSKERSLGEWQKLGVVRAAGQAFPRSGDKARLFLTLGGRGPSFLLLGNFRVIKRYNNADSYALAVGHLSDRLRGGGTFHTEWPAGDRPLTTEQRARIQQLLSDRGLYSGEVDGKIGSGSREAIRAYQGKVGLKTDGFDSLRLLQLLEDGR